MEKKLKFKNRAQSLRWAVEETLHLNGDIVEAGVGEGWSAEVICEAKGDKTLHLFDTFEGLPESMFSPIDASTVTARQHMGPGMYEASLETVKEKLREYKNVHYYPGIFPETAKPIEHKAFAFIHLDLDLYKSTLEALKFFHPRLVPGGIIISHNYTNMPLIVTRMPGVEKSFNDFFQDRPEEIEEIGFSQCMIKKLESGRTNG